jgi:hypothetical protein
MVRKYTTFLKNKDYDKLKSIIKELVDA